MSGTTLCPHCHTRFKVAGEQLEAHHGMVRCGHCLQAFDAHPGYIPDKPHPQLELPILHEPVVPLKDLPIISSQQEAEGLAHELPANNAAKAGIVEETPPVDEHAVANLHVAEIIAPPENSPDNSSAATVMLPPPVTRPMTLAEQVVIVQDDDKVIPGSRYRKWPWAVATLLLVSLLLLQAAYFFRVDLAARLPGLKPVLVDFCHLLGCSVPLPQKTGLMSIESSELVADAAHENQISLNVLLRNRAPYAQAFPNLEFTLNDSLDKPVARRILKPKDYLPPQESENIGLQSNHELNVKLYFNLADIKPTGYRLVLFYP